MNQRTVQILCFCLAAVCSRAARADEPLPSDPRVTTGKLPNGVTWLYRPHANPPGKMAMLVHIATGSLNETEDQRGLAHFLEHMAFNGTENFPPGQLVPYFESIGMEFGADLNAFTTFDSTTYMLYLPDPSVEQVDKGLMVLSDYAFRESLLNDEVEKERGVILSELLAGMSAQQRIRDKLFETLFVNTRLGQRLPIGLEKVISGATGAQLRDYYTAWYHPDRITVILVGDAAPEPYQPLLEKWFGKYRAPAAAQPQMGPELKPFMQERAIILSDPEYAQGDVDIYQISPARPPTTTLALARQDLIEQMTTWLMERRFSELVKKGAATFRMGSATVFGLLNAALIANASTLGEPKDWEKMLAELIVEVNRAREFGFLPAEFELCKSDLLAAAEDAARKEDTRNARSLLMQMMTKTKDGEPIMSAAQELDVVQKLLPKVKREEVNASFATHFRPGSYAYVLTMPKKDEIKLPSEEEVLAVARAAAARRPEPPADAKGAADLLPQEPTPGRLADLQKDDTLEITSGWLDNGVRVHHRFMDYKKDLVILTITLAGGEIEETAKNAGISQVAAEVFSQPATSRLASSDIEDIMTGKNIKLFGQVDDDAFCLALRGSPRDLEAGLRLAYTLLTDGKLEQTAFDNWKQGALQRYEGFSKTTQFAAFDTWTKAISGDDPRRVIALLPAQIEAQSVEEGQGWYGRLCREAPLEVAIVGEIALEQVQPLIEKYLGSLPKRARTAAHLDPLRRLRRQPGPLVHRVGVDTVTPQAWAVAGFMGCDQSEIGDVRALNVAANILDSRLIKRIREELGVVYSINVQSQPGQAYVDSGFFVTAAPCSPGMPDDIIKEAEAIFSAFAESGPTDEELQNAKKQVQNNLDTQLKEPNYWSERLQRLDLHTVQLADLKNVPEAYQALTAAQVQSVFKKYFVPERIFRVTASPNRPATQPTP